MIQSIFITTPMYYVNANPHLGHVYATTITDILARYYRLFDFDVFFATGTDEHGTKVSNAADKAGMELDQFRNKVASSFLNMTKKMNISHNFFSRTTSNAHHIAVIELWNKLLDNGYIYKAEYNGWYSVKDEAFYSEDEISDGKAPTGSPVEWHSEVNYFFKLTHFIDQLKELYKNGVIKIIPERRLNEVMRFLDDTNRDLSISRLKSKADGITVPNDPDQAIYVWIDALTSYISSLGYPYVTDTRFIKYSNNYSHVVGKEILKFHAVYWPAILLAAGLPLPKSIYVHGWLLVEGQKMSKSDGNIIDPVTIFDLYPTDATRFALIRSGATDEDISFTVNAIKEMINTELANEFGNLIRRTVSMIQNKSKGNIKFPDTMRSLYSKLDIWDYKTQEFITGDAKELICCAISIPSKIFGYLKKFQLHKIAEATIELATCANRYINQKKIWTMEDEEFSENIYPLIHAIYILGLSLYPIMPESALYMLYSIGYIQNSDGYPVIANESFYDQEGDFKFTDMKNLDRIMIQNIKFTNNLFIPKKIKDSDIIFNKLI